MLLDCLFEVPAKQGTKDKGQRRYATKDTRGSGTERK